MEFTFFLKVNRNKTNNLRIYNIKLVKEGRYLGNLLDYIKEGKGKFIVNNRDIYEGDFENDSL